MLLKRLIRLLNMSSGQGNKTRVEKICRTILIYIEHSQLFGYVENISIQRK